MTTIPKPEASQADLAEWYKAKEQASYWKNAEMLLRQKIFHGFFPEPKEGANKVALPDDYTLTATHVITRDIDKAALLASRPMFAEKLINVDKLVDYKPSLVIAEYRKLTEEEQKLFDQVLIVKAGSPQVKILPPAKPKV